jgi:hypothetical protein
MEARALLSEGGAIMDRAVPRPSVADMKIVNAKQRKPANW